MAGFIEEDTDIKTDLALLKKDMTSLYTIVDKLDATIDKLTEVTSSLDKMITIQQTHIDQQEKEDREIMERLTNLTDRVQNIEQNKWFIIGVAAAVGFIIAQIPMVNSLLQ
jgi:ElaB/YqjD/DUF883 family membrane-anchored ribosome-binding protein